MNALLHQVVIAIVLYAYLGVVFFALYRGATVARTVARFSLFVVVDLALSLLVSGVLFGLVYESVLRF